VSEVPNILRVYLSDSEEVQEMVHDVMVEEAIVIECNIDDMNPEQYGFVLDKLFDAGASDAWLVPIIMKKSRPAITLSVLCTPEKSAGLKDLIFKHTSSIGLRESKVTKSMLHRETIRIETKYGEVRVKQCMYGGKAVRSKPEFEDCKALANQHNISIDEIENEVLRNL
jgi:uncharacterized protein (DUF111 family)